MSISFRQSHKIFRILALTFYASSAYAYTAPASLPIEPASPDEDVIPQGESVEIDIERPAPKTKRTDEPPPPRAKPPRKSRGEPAEPYETEVSRSPLTTDGERRASRYSLSGAEPGAGDFSVQGRMSLNANGFGGVFKLVQYPRSWLGITETFRYFKNEEEDRAFLNRRGVLVGLELHPYRSNLLSPFIDTQLGWESFEREDDFGKAKSVVLESAAGLELRLSRFASLVAQWTEAYYPDLKDRLFYPSAKDKDPKRFQTAEILFNLKWEKKLF